MTQDYVAKTVWKVLKPDREKIQKLKDYFAYPSFIYTILVNRGVDTPEKLETFIRPALYDLHSPFYFKEMEKALDRIELAIEKKEAILIFGDRDVDGVTATAILYRYLQKLSAHVVYRVPEGLDNYGLTKDVIRWAVTCELSLIITVDCGITAIDEIEYANSLGLDIIITDHHQQMETVPKAYAVINPKVKSDTYPFAMLSGAGVAFKLVCAMTEKLALSEIYNEEIVFFDLETTGLNPTRDDIVEIGAVKVKNGVVIEEYQTLVKIDYPMPKEATAVNHITDKMLAESGIPIKSALSEFLEFIGNRKLVGHNVVEFDMKFLAHHVKKQLGKTLSNPVEDTLKMARVILKKAKDHKLLTVAENLGICVDKSSLHRSVADSRVCAEIYRRLQLSRNHKMQEILHEYMPLAAIGTVADIMPLICENRSLVKNGLKLVTMSSVGLIGLIRASKINPEKLSTKDISWNIAPLLNSPGRVGDASLSVELLVSNKLKEVENLVEEIVAKDNERKNIVEDGLGVVNGALDLEAIGNDKLFFIASEKISKGTTGLIANRIAYQMQIPAIVITIDGEYASGSVRSAYFDVVGMLESMADVFIQYGGHKFAGGFTIKKSQIAEFERRAKEYTQAIDNVDMVEEIVVDAILENLDEMNQNHMRYLENIFEPTGNQNEFPKFLVENVKIQNFKTMGKENTHCLFSIQKGSKTMNVIGWNFAKRINELLESEGKNAAFDIVASPEINNYMNIEELRFSLIDIKPKSSRA